MKFQVSSKEFHARADLRALDVMHTELRGDISVESLTQYVLGTIDIIHRFSNAVKNITFRTFKSVKRSELHDFVDNNAAKQKALESLHYGICMEDSVYLPNGMKVTYPEAVRLLSEAYKKCDIINLLTTAITALGTVNTALIRNIPIPDGVVPVLSEPDVAKRMDELSKTCFNLNGTVSELDTSIETATQLTTAIFDTTTVTSNNTVYITDKSGRTIETVVFKTMFKSMEEFRFTRTELLNMEQYLVQIPTVTELLGKLSVISQSIQRTIELYPSTVTPKFVDDLVRYIKYLAISVSYYGYAVASQMVIEHNFLLSCHYLYNKL